uniref:B-cell receptor CD22 n=1 Tax=Gopherus evgoodei TaxID=1825980 RepID=A0A8C4WNF8_9SAUR
TQDACLPLAAISVTLLLPGFLCQCDPPVEVPESLIAWTGACLSIPSLTWYLNPVYVLEKKDFNGTVLYKHNVAISPAFAGRVRFLGDLERDCSLQLSDLQASENGSYGLRLAASNPRKQEEEKNILHNNFSLCPPGTASPPAPQIKAPSELRESIPAQAVCSIAYYCPDYPITLMWVGLGHRTSEPTTRTDSGRTENTLTFTPTWQDHGTNVTCRLNTQAGTPSSESSVVLDSFPQNNPFKSGPFYSPDAPKDVHVELVTGSQIQEGNTVVLSCSCKAHPPVSSYTWYRNGQHIPAQTQQELRFDKIHPNQSGSYHCKPQNRVGMLESLHLSQWMCSVSNLLLASQAESSWDILLENFEEKNYLFFRLIILIPLVLFKEQKKNQFSPIRKIVFVSHVLAF